MIVIFYCVQEPVHADQQCMGLVWEEDSHGIEFIVPVCFFFFYSALHDNSLKSNLLLHPTILLPLTSFKGLFC